VENLKEVTTAELLECLKSEDLLERSKFRKHGDKGMVKMKANRG